MYVCVCVWGGGGVFVIYLFLLFYYKAVLFGLPLSKMPSHRKMALAYSIDRTPVVEDSTAGVSLPAHMSVLT